VVACPDRCRRLESDSLFLSHAGNSLCLGSHVLLDVCRPGGRSAVSLGQPGALGAVSDDARRQFRYARANKAREDVWRLWRVARSVLGARPDRLQHVAVGSGDSGAGWAG